MSDKNSKDTEAKTEDLPDSDLDQAAGGNFEEVKVTLKKSSNKGGKNLVGDDVGVIQ